MEDNNAHPRRITGAEQFHDIGNLNLLYTKQDKYILGRQCNVIINS